MSDAETFQALLEALPYAAALLDLQGRVVSCNPALGRFLGRTREALLGVRLITAFTRPQDAAREAELFLELADGLRDNYRMEKCYERADGSWRAGLVHVALVRSSSPTRPFCFTTLLDVSEERSSRERVGRQAKLDALRRLGSEVVHRLNPFVLAGRGHLRILQEATASNDLVRHAVDNLLEALDQASRLVRDLAIFASCPVLQPVAIDLDTLLRSLAAQLRRVHGSRMTLDLRSSSSLPRVLGDEEQLRLALSTLLDFAATRCPPQGKLGVHVGVARPVPPHSLCAGEVPERVLDCEEADGSGSGDIAVVCIRVPGPPLSPETWDRLFEPFAVTEELPLEVSLGLARAYGIICRMGGCIDLGLSDPGGWTVSIRLPIARDTVPDLELSAGLTETQEHLPTVIVVEDDDSRRRQYREFLEARRCRVLEARSPGDALWLCLRHAGPIHLMLVEAVVPHVRVEDLIEQARSLHPELGVILLGSSADREGPAEDDKTLRIAKPVEAEGLAQAMDQLLRFSSQQLRSSSPS